MVELQVVFCFCFLGKMIDGSRLDQVFEETRKFSLQCILVDVLQSLITFSHSLNPLEFYPATH